MPALRPAAPTVSGLASFPVSIDMDFAGLSAFPQYAALEVLSPEAAAADARITAIVRLRIHLL